MAWLLYQSVSMIFPNWFVRSVTRYSIYSPDSAFNALVVWEIYLCILFNMQYTVSVGGRGGEELLHTLSFGIHAELKKQPFCYDFFSVCIETLFVFVSIHPSVWVCMCGILSIFFCLFKHMQRRTGFKMVRCRFISNNVYMYLYCGVCSLSGFLFSLGFVLLFFRDLLFFLNWARFWDSDLYSVFFFT